MSDMPGTGRHRAARPRRHRRIAALGAAVAAAAAVTLTGGGTARAAGILPSTTTLTASNYAPAPGQSVTFTATVSVNGMSVGIGLTPQGTVTLTATNQWGELLGTLGSGTLNGCLLTACTVSVTVPASAVPAGTDYVNAAYAGDSLTIGSTGQIQYAAPVTLTPADQYGDNVSYYCRTGQQCHSGLVTSSDGSTAFAVDQPAEPSYRYLRVGFDATALPCATTTGGDTAHWDIGINPDQPHGPSTGTKTVTYYAYDAAATAGLAWSSPHVCYASDSQFTGSYPASPPWNNTPGGSTFYAHGPVPYDSGADAYVGLLDTCASNGNTVPCIQSDAAATPPTGHTSAQKIVLLLGPDDPRMGN